MTEGLRSFATQYDFAINDPELIRRYRMYEDGKHDIATQVFVAEERGRSEEKKEIAKSLKDSGMDFSFITKHTGLTTKEIEAL